MPRRYFEMGDTNFIPESAQSLNAFVTVIALIVGFSQLVFLYNLFTSASKGRKAERNPWQANSLEWQTPELPPGHGNFGDELPTVHRWPFDYGLPGAKKDYVMQTEAPSEVQSS